MKNIKKGIIKNDYEKKLPTYYIYYVNKRNNTINVIFLKKISTSYKNI